MTLLKKWSIAYHYEKGTKGKEPNVLLFAEATGRNAKEALEIFYRNHDYPDKIVVTSCRAKNN